MVNNFNGGNGMNLMEKNGTGSVLNMGKVLKVQTYLMQALITLRYTIKTILENMC